MADNVMDQAIPDNISAGLPPSRTAPPPSRVPVSTGGLYPRDYRRRLREARPFRDVSEYDSTTIVYDAATPLIGTAVHYSSQIRAELQPKLKLSPEERLYEEDPETHRFLGMLQHTITPNQSRFELDLNRPPDTTLYTKPSLAWGLDVWKDPLNQYEKEFGMEKWYEFHTLMDCAVEDAIERFGFAIVFDFHSYNYQRKGPVDWRTDDKPVINLGTRHLVLDERTQGILDWFRADLKRHTIMGEPCMIEENGVFYGGYLNRRLAHLYGSKVLTLSVEYKKVYMDENTGELHDDILQNLVEQMDDTIRRLAEHLNVPIRDRPEIPFAGRD